MTENKSGILEKNAEFGIVARSPGGPEVLEWTALEPAAPGPGEVRVAQRAVGVNFIDTYYRQGAYPWPTNPLIPGGEAAGIVEAVGPGAAFKAGDHVAYVLPTGAYRTHRVVAADRLVKLPDGVPFEVAASLMLKGMTAQYLLKSTFPVQPGNTVLVHAAAGGVGLVLGQWLKALGITCIGTAGSPEKCALAATYGYTHVIDYRAEDFTARVKQLTGGKGCDVVYDSVGHDTWRGSLKCLKPRGMFVCFGQSSGAIADFKFSDLVSNGSLYATRPSLFDYIKSREDLESRAADLFAEVAAGHVKAHIGLRVALRDAAQAHRDLEARHTQGATVLLP
jgi:NADPH2:quinone reductase